MVGRLVCSLSGRDKGYFMVVVKEEGKFLYVCDGKERPLSRPKKKNAKHLAFTGTTLEKDSYLTDKSLRKTLAVIRSVGEKRRNCDV